MYTYFIADSHGCVKIGCSGHIAQRLTSLQTAHACELTLIGVTDGPETTAHRMWGHNRLRGEWFTLTPALRAWIKSVSLDWGLDQHGHVQVEGVPADPVQAMADAARDESQRHEVAKEARSRVALADFMRKNPID